ncbi:phosphoadenosine phosphosulfate reductase family protein [Flagellimonas eckloniae]|uniref:Phosphoadenylylsulfate reductase n=1 Tax=Flagellimonas eckloniae TaxID=346185 RepID=A0A0Q1DLN5_9FLAO|nr:phosphoadenosine phosphosulfate reductase family protein [Allomuricauda eckloniae]KQC29877.1 phosphoadenylylsulfate reductase [Allomuricauda eckloniae]
MKINLDLEYWNNVLREKSPGEIIDWALLLSSKRIVTTSFGKYSAVLLNTFFLKNKSIDVIWCDTGYNLSETYSHASFLMEKFSLCVHSYVPKQSRAFTEFKLGMPSVDEPGHEEFTEIVKLEPFARALREHNPDIWFTNIRVRQTEYRNSKDILSYSKDGILKISPFYYWSDEDLDIYLEKNNLPKNENYFDPIKALTNRECGIHLQ